MKKIFSIIAVLFAVTSGLFADDFNKEQLALRLEIVKFMTNEGFQPKIDKDGDIMFKNNDYSFYMIINKKWMDPFLVTLYTDFNYSDEYSKENLEKCISAVAQSKVVKLYCMDKSYSYRSDIFCENAEVVKSTFYSLLKEFVTAMNKVAITIEAGLGGIDITNNKDAVFDKAIELYRKDKYSYSFPLFKYLAESGYEKAYGYMGLSYEFGDGTDKDESLMIKNYEKAIENGYNWCAYRLGKYYHSKNKYSEAMNNFIKCGANENGFRSEALYFAGKMYENGEGVSKSLSDAVLCYKKSVQYADEIECDARLALMRLGETIERKEDFVNATKSMLAGLTPEEMYEKGEEYELGLGGNYISLTKAYAYFKASADKGYIKGLNKMGDIYINKYYPFNDKAKSDKYYSKVIKLYKKNVKTDGEACYKLGYMYNMGRGVEKDIEQAKNYYKSGALLGDINAAWRLGLIYKDEMEYSEAFKFLYKAADGGQGMAMYELAKFYENGIGTSQNKSKAIEWYTKCSESTYMAKKDAAEALKRLGANSDKE